MTVLARLDAALIGRGGAPAAYARHLAGQIHGLVGVLGAVERHQNPLDHRLLPNSRPPQP
jgi:hypothetical protein